MIIRSIIVVLQTYVSFSSCVSVPFVKYRLTNVQIRLGKLKANTCESDDECWPTVIIIIVWDCRGNSHCSSAVCCGLNRGAAIYVHYIYMYVQLLVS